MHRPRSITLLVLLTLLAACAQQGRADDERARPVAERLRERLEARRAPDTEAGAPARGQQVTLQVQHAGQRREVILHLPPAARPDRPLPLVLALHGGGGHAAYMADDERYGLGRKADEAGVLVAFPNGFSRLPGGRFATWNAGGCCGDSRDRGIDDVGFLRAVVDAVARRQAVDRGRVFATGMSNGGMMAYRLACEAADLVAAVAAVAGTEGVADCKPSRPVAVLHLHARDDDHVLFDGGAGPEAFRDRGQVMDFVAVPETLRRWVDRQHCAATPTRVLQVPGGFCERHDGCDGGVSVQLCVTEHGGHSWPGAERTRRGKPPASQALDANDLIFDFFARAPRR